MHIVHKNRIIFAKKSFATVLAPYSTAPSNLGMDLEQMVDWTFNVLISLMPL